MVRTGLFAHPDWYSYLMRRVFEGRDEFRLYVVERMADEQPLLLLPLRLSRSDAIVPGGQVVAAVSHPENFAPLMLALDATVDDCVPLLEVLFQHLRYGGGEAPSDGLRLGPLADGSQLAEDVLTALRQSGYWTQTYANSFNYYEVTAGVSHEAYLASRSANFRYNVRRRQRALERTGSLEIVVYQEGDLSRALDEYRQVSLRSWKAAPTMIALGTLELMELAARHGSLRLGILRLDGIALAAQFWIVTGGVAHCARLAYREDYKHLAPGVVLTDAVLAWVLDRDRVVGIDFGYGTEDYKQGWMRDSRCYFGLAGFNRGTRLGLLYGVRHILGRPLKQSARWLRDRLRGHGPTGRE